MESNGQKLSSNVEDSREASPYQALKAYVSALINDYNYRWDKTYAKPDPEKSKAISELAKQAGINNIEDAVKAEEQENIRKFREWREESFRKSSQIQGGEAVSAHSAPSSTPTAAKQEPVVKR